MCQFERLDGLDTITDLEHESIDLGDHTHAIFGSPLALSTIVALVLNLVLNVGVSTRSGIELDIHAAVGEGISTFLQRQGASWGARGELIRRATLALTEWVEDLRAIGAADRWPLNFDTTNSIWWRPFHPSRTAQNP